MIKAVIFDCFGVLMLDSKQSLAESFPKNALVINDITKQADIGLIDQSEQLQQLSEITNMTVSEIKNYLEAEHKLNQPLVEIISSLRSSYTIGMISNIGRNWFDRLVPVEVIELFDEIILSSEVGMVKPYPEIFELFCQRTNLEPADVFFIDDLEDNVEGARWVGMESVKYKSIARLNKDLINAKIIS